MLGIGSYSGSRGGRLDDRRHRRRSRRCNHGSRCDDRSGLDDRLVSNRLGGFRLLFGDEFFRGTGNLLFQIVNREAFVKRTQVHIDINIVSEIDIQCLFQRLFNLKVELLCLGF
ncbi:hypothetical protein DK66_3161 [Brucella suis 1330]|nr:hypothetical protein DK66_3161 [Brucella suis 1330]